MAGCSEGDLIALRSVGSYDVGERALEAPEEEVAATLPVVTAVMEEAAMPALALAVPLRVDARAAGNWEEAH